MKRSVRVGVSFAKLPKAQLNGFAILVLVCTAKNIVLFPNLPVTLAALSTLQLAYQEAMNAAAVGGKKDTAALKDARNMLVSALRQISAYIQSLSLTEAQALSSGFDALVWSKTRITLPAPVITGLDNSLTGQLGVYLQAVNGAKSYHVQICTGTGAWLDAGIWPNTKNIVIPNLTPGTVCSVRVRAVGGSTQYSPWSRVVSLMAT